MCFFFSRVRFRGQILSKKLDARKRYLYERMQIQEIGHHEKKQKKIHPDAQILLNVCKTCVFRDIEAVELNQESPQRYFQSNYRKILTFLIKRIRKIGWVLE